MMLGSQETDAATNAATAAALTLVSAAGTAQITPASAGQKDTTWTKLFVGGLPYHTTDKSLREHFSVFGDIEEAVVITDRQTNKSRGYGFVIMGDRSSAERACKDPNPIIDGRKANVNLAILGAKPRTNITPTAFPFAAATGLRTGYPVIPNQFGIHSPYIYGSPYLGAAAAANSTAAGLVPIQATQLTQAAALAAATNQFYEYQNAVAAASPYPAQYAASFEAYPYSSTAAANAAAANYLAPYAAYALPQASSAGANAGTFSLATPYQQAANASLQEARLQ